MKTRSALLFPLAVLACTFVLFSGSAKAVSQATGQALEISPPVLNLRANPGQTVTSTIQLRDVSTSSLVVRNQINDFVAGGEDGTPKLLLESGQDSPYSLKDWVQPLPQFTMKPKAINRLQLKIKVPKNASPGGYYAVIRFTGTRPDLDGTGVSLSASLGTLVLLKVNGNAKESMSMEQFYATTNDGKPSSLFESSPITLVERVRNTGNIHQQPNGQVTVKDFFGNVIATLNVNLPGNNVLPGSVRKFQQNLDSTVIGDRFLFGRYTADVKLTYGSKQQTFTSSTSFWVIPYRLIAFAIILLVIIAILIRIGLARYNERVIERSRSRRRRR